jgi:hypothetical protein
MRPRPAQAHDNLGGFHSDASCAARGADFITQADNLLLAVFRPSREPPGWTSPGSPFTRTSGDRVTRAKATVTPRLASLLPGISIRLVSGRLRLATSRIDSSMMRNGFPKMPTPANEPFSELQREASSSSPRGDRREVRRPLRD